MGAMKIVARTVALLASIVLCPSGCGPETEGPPRSDDPPSSCPTPSHGPTRHRGPLLADETWRAIDGPHLVEGDVQVGGGATLTVEACAAVELSPGASIDVGSSGGGPGRLVAEGTQNQPIVFRRSGREEPWGHILVRSPATARLTHVTLRGGGAGDPAAGVLRLEGDGILPSDPVLSARHVTVAGARGVGVRARAGARFTEDSLDLTVVGAGARPVRVDALGIVGFPAGSYVVNAQEEIQIDGEVPVLESATLKPLGVPYHVGGDESPNLVVGGRPDGALVTLTLEPGVVLRMQKGGSLQIETDPAARAATGALVAVGAPMAPIVLTSDQASPRPGDWRGLWFGGYARSTNRVEHVRLEYTGASCGCLLVTCTAGVTVFDGAVIFTQQPPSVFVKASTVAHGKGHAFVLGYSGEPLDFASQNTVESVMGCTQTMPLTAACAAPRPVCR